VSEVRNDRHPAGEDVAGTTWLLVAAGFHFRGGMEKANAAMASYLLDRGASVHLVAHSADPLFLQHRHATIHVVPRPLNSFAKLRSNCSPPIRLRAWS
jgi:hypothetical protein